jgi:hypothetical protein
MQFARTILDRITAQTIIPMINLGVSGAIAMTILELLRDWREARAPRD